MATRLSLLKFLTHDELKEIGRRYDVALPASLKKGDAAKYLAEHLPLPDAEVQTLVESYQLAAVIRSG